MIKTSLITIKNIFQKEGTFDGAWAGARSSLMDFFQIEQVRLYRCDYDPSCLFATPVEGDRQLLRLPLGGDSVAGFTAEQRMPLTLQRLDQASLDALRPGLRYDTGYDAASKVAARNLVSVPIQFDDDLLGVLQLVNKKTGDFSREDEAHCRLLVNIMGQKLHEDISQVNDAWDLLVVRGVVGRSELNEARTAARKSGRFLSVVLQKDFGLDEALLGDCLQAYYQVEFVSYVDQPVPDATLKGISRQYLIKNLWVPLKVKDDTALVLVPDPHDPEKHEEITRVLNIGRCELRVGLPEHILAYLGDRSQMTRGLDPAAVSLPAHHAAEQEQDEEFEEDFENDDFNLTESLAADIEAAVDGYEIEKIEEEDISQESRQLAVRFVNKIIMHAFKTGASDIHIEPSRAGRPGMVRMRVDGSCERILSVPETIIRPVISRIKILSNLNISERRMPQDGKARVRFKGRELELRVATIPTVHGESAVLRMLSSGRAMSFDRLNLSEGNKLLLERLMKKPHGIFLVVGPTGSGKTTTLHSILARINTPDKKIWTVEDPVEITQPGLQQVQVEMSIGLDFAKIMRAFLRADPDVILVGEMRDLSTAQIGVEASLTGHMVYTTLHTNSAPETVTRLLDMGVEAINFSEALQGILAQRLVKTLCPDCRVSVAPSDEEWQYLIDQYGPEYFPELKLERASARIFKAKGCPRCNGSGYRGRTGIHELLVATPGIRKAIVRKLSAEDIARIAVEQGMRTLYQDGIAKILKGDIDILQLQKVTVAE